MKLYKFMYLALATLTFAACNKEDAWVDNWQNDPLAVHINASVGNHFTRTTPQGNLNNGQFNQGDILAVSNGENFVTYTYTNQAWEPQPSKYLKWDKKEYTFTAFYPGKETQVMEPFTVPTDQSTPEKIAAADYMTYSGLHTQNASSTISFQMQRQTARIIFQIDKINLGSIGETTLKMQIRGKNKADATNYTAFESLVNYSGPMIKGSTFTALVAPNATAATEEVFAHLTVNNYPFVMKGIPVVEAGKSYTFHVAIGNKETMELVSHTVTDWTDATISSEGTTKLALEVDEYSHTITSYIAGSLYEEAISSAFDNGSTLNLEGIYNNTVDIDERLVTYIRNHFNEDKPIEISFEKVKNNIVISYVNFIKTITMPSHNTTFNHWENDVCQINHLEKLVFKSNVTYFGTHVFAPNYKLKTIDLSYCTALPKKEDMAFFGNNSINVILTDNLLYTAETERETKGWDNNFTFVGKSGKEINLFPANQAIHASKEGNLTEAMLTEVLGNNNTLHLTGTYNEADLQTLAAFVATEHNGKLNIDLTHLKLPANTILPTNLFKDGKGIKHLSLPECVTKIPAGLLQNNAVEEVTLHGNIREIGDAAFEGATALTTLHMENCYRLPVLGNNVFPAQAITVIFESQNLADECINAGWPANNTYTYVNAPAQAADM